MDTHALRDLGAFLVGLAGFVTALVSFFRSKSTRQEMRNGQAKRIEQLGYDIGDVQAALRRHVDRVEEWRNDDAAWWRAQFDRLERRLLLLERDP